MLGMPNKVDVRSGYFPGLNNVISFHTNSAELLVLEPRNVQYGCSLSQALPLLKNETFLSLKGNNFVENMQEV